ncbi:MAG TPA: hypothetical protein VGR66_06060 [Candidatus Eisenbacteria bacterium]|jgi:hypothetical protein|nr:hypothetical protein [Candidatus Eisenbacteria bacterium]
MRAARVFALMLLMVGCMAGASFAQSYSNATGTFDAKIAVVPAELPDGGASLPPELQSIGPDLYVGQVTVSKSGGGYSVSFKGSREDGAKLMINANFSSDWAGLKFGSLSVGSSFESGVITGDDIAHLISANINGVGTVNGVNQRVIARIGAGGVVENFKILPAPGPLR